MKLKFQMPSNKPGSDHAIHLGIVRRIKSNDNKFLTSGILSHNEKNPFYPQLFHWCLSYLNVSFIKGRHGFLNRLLYLIQLGFFNFFLFSSSQYFPLTTIEHLLVNIIYITFPFSYVLWNSKNAGLSARRIGLILGELFLYSLFFYKLEGKPWMLVIITCLVLLIILTSQFATQMALLSAVFFAIFFNSYLLLVTPLLAMLVFYIIMPQVCTNYIRGQYNHKRNYALFLASIFILKARPSIYQDFLYDFWKKIKINFRRGCFYVLTNPIIEALYGFSYLWLALYMHYFAIQGEERSDLLIFSSIGIILFFITSFRVTRFLGEPQRYMEFFIPIYSLIAIWVLTPNQLFFMLFFNLLLIFVPKYFLRKEQSSEKGRQMKNEVIEQLGVLVGENPEVICTSNEHNLAKALGIFDYKICRPDYSVFYKDAHDFNMEYFALDHGKISPQAISNYMESFDLNMIILNNSIYNSSELPLLTSWSLEKEIGHYSIYKKN